MALSSENLKVKFSEWLRAQSFVYSVSTGELMQPWGVPVLMTLESEKVLLALTF